MGQQTTITTLEVQKTDWSNTRIVTELLDAPLSDDEVLLKVDRLALTANNISYAASGDSLGYWRFFPGSDDYGRIPAMGWGEVVASAHSDIQLGERVWGFFPFSTHLKILAGKANPGHFRDVSAHRSDLAPVYAQFDRALAYPLYDPAREDQDSLLRGLFLTSWLVDDFLSVNASFGAGACLITSASSKTSIALGHCVQQRGTMASIAITSASKVAFCESLGCYDDVVTYDEIASLDASRRAVIVDMAGSAKVLSDLHHHYRDNLKHSCRIGATHYEEMGSVAGLPGPSPEFFFAPTHLKTRSSTVGPEKLLMQLGTAYAEFRQSCDDWLTLHRHFGSDEVSMAYQAVLAGTTDPASGQIISLWPEGAESP